MYLLVPECRAFHEPWSRSPPQDSLLKHSSELLASVRVRALPILMLLLTLSTDMQLSAHLSDWQFFWERVFSVQRQSKAASLFFHCAGDWLDLLWGWHLLDLLKDLVLKFLHLLQAALQLLQLLSVSVKRCYLRPETAPCSVHSHEWAEGRLESMQAQHFQLLSCCSFAPPSSCLSLWGPNRRFRHLNSSGQSSQQSSNGQSTPQQSWRRHSSTFTSWVC